MFSIRTKKKKPPKTPRKQGLRWENVIEDRPELGAFLKARADSHARYEDKAETNFWVCLVFQSWDQKQEFLKQLGAIPTLYQGMYVDGETLAKAIGKSVTPNTLPPIKTVVQKRLAAIVLEDERRRAMRAVEKGNSFG
jgi:hypothetical protein